MDEQHDDFPHGCAGSGGRKSTRQGCRILQHGNVRHDELSNRSCQTQTNNLRAFKDYLESLATGYPPM
ncbi:MAG: hypothetical protein V8T45_06430 [Oscillospiraceae bacterium]